MVIVDFHIAPGVHPEVELAVLRKQIEHMVQKRYIGLDLGYARTVDRKSQFNVRLIRFARDFSPAPRCLKVLFSHEYSLLSPNEFELPAHVHPAPHDGRAK